MMTLINHHKDLEPSQPLSNMDTEESRNNQHEKQILPKNASAFENNERSILNKISFKEITS